MPVCVNQLGNGGVFQVSRLCFPHEILPLMLGRMSQCGKQVDLITEAIKLDPDAQGSLPKNVVCLGMCITGKEWKVIVTASNASLKLGTAFVSKHLNRRKARQLTIRTPL